MACSNGSSGSGPPGSNRSISASTSRATPARADWKSCTDLSPHCLRHAGGFGADRAVGRQSDLLDFGFGFGQLLLAMALQADAALVDRDRLVELDLAAL